MKPCLVYIRPLDTKAGARVDVRVGDGPTADTFGTGNVRWEPALASRPVLSIELMSPDMDGRVQAGQARFTIALRQLRAVTNIAALYWRGAAVIINNNGILEGPTAVPDFWGYVTDASVDLDTGKLQITAEASVAFIDKPLLTLEFDGSGGAGGDATLRGTLYPVGMGVVKNLQPVFFDNTRNIAMVDGYGNTTSIDWLGEGLNSLGAATANYGTYALLAAAIDAGNVPRGRWATSIAAGQPSYVGLGAPPTGIITVHATFSYPRVGAMMKRVMLAAAHANVAAARVDSAAFDALDAALAYPAHYWTAEQRNVKELLEALAQSVNATPLVSFQNQVTVTRAVAAVAEVLTLDRSGQVTPRVLNWHSGTVEPPYFVLKARAARPATVLSTDQVNFTDTIIDRGLYAGATVYRAGNVVWLVDGSQWLYLNATAASGNAPPASPTTADAYWQRLQPPKSVTNFGYTGDLDATRGGVFGTNLLETSGGAIATLPNFKTSSGTAAAIAAQGALATQNSVNLGTQVAGTLGTGNAAAGLVNSNVTIAANGALGGAGGGSVTFPGLGGGAVGQLATLYFGGSLFLEAAGGAVATLANFKTSSGTAAAIASQGAFATLNSAGYGSSLLTGFGALAQSTYVRLNGPAGGVVYAGIYNNAGTGYVDEAGYQTALGTAAAILGQAATATSTDFIVITGLTRPAAYAGTSFTATKVGNYPALTNQRANGFYTTTSSNGNWQTGAVTDERFVGGSSISFRLDSDTTMVGLRDVTTAIPGATTYTALQFSIHRSTDGNWYIYNLGAGTSLGTAKNGVTFSSSTVWRVTYDGVNYTAYADGAIMGRKVAAAPNMVVQGLIALGTDLASHSVSNVLITSHPDYSSGPQLIATASGDKVYIGFNSALNCLGGTSKVRSASPLVGPARARFRLNGTGMIAGIGDAAGNMLAGIHFSTGGGRYCFSDAAGFFYYYSAAAASASSVLEVRYDGAYFYFYQDDVYLTRTSTTAGQSVYFYANLYDASPAVCGVLDVSFIPFGDVTVNQPIVSRINRDSGRVSDPTMYNTQAILGPNSTTSLTPTYTVGGSNVTVNLPSHTRYVAGPSGPLNLAYGSGSGVVAFSTYWAAYIDDPTLSGIASPTIGFTSTPSDLLYAGRYQVASGVTPAAGGGGGSTGTGGGGGGGVPGCVCVMSFMPHGGLAGEVQAGWEIKALDEHNWDVPSWRACQGNAIEMQDCVRLTSASGITLVLSACTPCTLYGGDTVAARDVLRCSLAVEDAAGFRWEQIVAIDDMGERPVAHISCAQGTYAAGERAGAFIYTHNFDKP